MTSATINISVYYAVAGSLELRCRNAEKARMKNNIERLLSYYTYELCNLIKNIACWISPLLSRMKLLI